MTKTIEVWVNGALQNPAVNLAVASMTAGNLKQLKGWEVIEAYEVGMLIIFSPNYGGSNL